MKRLALGPLAALSILAIASSHDSVRARLDAQLRLNSRTGSDFDLNVALELRFGLAR